MPFRARVPCSDATERHPQLGSHLSIGGIPWGALPDILCDVVHSLQAYAAKYVCGVRGVQGQRNRGDTGKGKVAGL